VKHYPPKVSICLPNLNTRAFLPDRFRTIREQTLEDWELLAYDSHSIDGAWEYIEEAAAKDPRITAWQGPRAGTPGSWTPCVRAARGQYVYIATSDDTMAPDCLEKLAAALDAHPECDVAHCALRPIDASGQLVPDLANWWLHESMFAVSSGALIDVPHLRKAPFDGVLHLLGDSVFISITQLLIRRSLFDRIGFFERRWGSVGDFNWSMRAGLVANTVHVPGTWGGWRVHAGQATAGVAFSSPDHGRVIDAMIDDAFAVCGLMMSPQWQRRIAELSARARPQRAFTRAVAARRRRSAPRRAAYLAGALLTGSGPAREYVKSRLLGQSAADWVQRNLRPARKTPFLVPSV
jgi:hypothetical protein